MKNLGLMLEEQFEIDRCDPKKHNINYCVDYGEKDCEKTCDYATGKKEYKQK